MKVGRKARTKPVFQTTAYLTEDAVNALAGIRLKLPLCRDIRITTNSDALEISAIELDRVLDAELIKIRSASARPTMQG